MRRFTFSINKVGIHYTARNQDFVDFIDSSKKEDFPEAFNRIVEGFDGVFLNSLYVRYVIVNLKEILSIRIINEVKYLLSAVISLF